MSALTVNDLLAGAEEHHLIQVPLEFLSDPVRKKCTDQGLENGQVKLAPLSLRSIHRIIKAAKDDDTLMSALMIREAMIEPDVTHDQVMQMPGGLVRFLLSEVQRISGMNVTEDELAETVQEPLARACFVLAKEFGWSPSDIAGLTVGQILMYLEMIRTENTGGNTP